MPAGRGLVEISNGNFHPESFTVPTKLQSPDTKQSANGNGTIGQIHNDPTSGVARASIIDLAKMTGNPTADAHTGYGIHGSNGGRSEHLLTAEAHLPQSLQSGAVLIGEGGPVQEPSLAESSLSTEPIIIPAQPHPAVPVIHDGIPHRPRQVNDYDILLLPVEPTGHVLHRNRLWRPLIEVVAPGDPSPVSSDHQRRTALPTANKPAPVEQQRDTYPPTLDRFVSEVGQHMKKKNKGLKSHPISPKVALDHILLEGRGANPTGVAKTEKGFRVVVSSADDAKALYGRLVRQASTPLTSEVVNVQDFSTTSAVLEIDATLKQNLSSLPSNANSLGLYIRAAKDIIIARIEAQKSLSEAKKQQTNEKLKEKAVAPVAELDHRVATALDEHRPSYLGEPAPGVVQTFPPRSFYFTAGGNEHDHRVRQVVSKLIYRGGAQTAREIRGIRQQGPKVYRAFTDELVK